MITVAVRSWAAWSPGIETQDDWRRWATNPHPLAREGAPAVRFVPAMLRRRCDQLSRMMLQTAHDATNEVEVGGVDSVFASRHGSFAQMISLLEDLASDQALSPRQFSHSVHNTQAGLFSIWANNNRPSCSISARDQTFPHGFLEATSLLHSRLRSLKDEASDSSSNVPVLLVTGDEAIPDAVAELSNAPNGAYALALLLGPATEATGLELSFEVGGEPHEAEFPPALTFLRWFLSDEPSLHLPFPERTWVWNRR
ncbi:MAG: beta-ketoacyl synthase chain length factor [bacterium]|nr:beta-ketoacyl synthase chain length factor [bacterium]